MSVLEVTGLKKRFGEKEVLRGVDFAVSPHSLFGFIGRNGAGKTTTMKAILGLLPIDHGEIRVMDEAVRYGETATNRHIGYLPDVPEFYDFMSAREYLVFCAQIGGMSAKEAKTRADELLELVGLADERHRVKGFSRGMKQRLGIAQALLNRPKLLICDEPTSALDPLGRKEILDTLLSVKDETTVLFSTHILSDVERICTDVAFLEEGRIVLEGPLSKIRLLHKKDTFLVALTSEEENAMLLSQFPCAQKTEEGLLFAANEETVAQVLHLIAERGMHVRLFKRMEPTLEDLFLEVTGR